MTPARGRAARGEPRADRARRRRRGPGHLARLREPLEDANERLGRAWGVVGHLNAVMNSPELREAYNANLPKVTQYYTELSQHQGLFAKYKALSGERASSSRSTRAQRKIVENELRDFRLGGAELPPEEKARFMAIREKLSELSSRFSDNLLDATNAFAHYATDAARARRASRRTCCRRRAKRRRSEGQAGLEVHAARALLPAGHAVRREPRPARADVPRLRDARLRVRQAGMGQHRAHRRDRQAAPASSRGCSASRTTPSTRSSPRWPSRRGRCSSSWSELAARAKPYAERDLDELTEFARDELGSRPARGLGPRLRLREAARRALRLLRPGGEAVLPGDDGAARHVPAGGDGSTGCVSSPRTAPVWHPDVRFFAIRDRDGALIGQFYVDLYARPSKRGGAWMDEAITRRRKDGRLQTPVAYLNCNFSAPVGGKPGALHARRGHHAVPRVRPRPAPPADARRRARRCGHQRRGMGRGRAALASSWRTSAGSGTCSRR